MSWLERFRDAESEASGQAEAATAPEPESRSAPGISALFDGVEADGTHAVLDLGPAAGTHLDIFGRYARKVRFGSFLPYPPRGLEWAAALRALPPNPGRPYDIVLLWNLLDRLAPDERESLVVRLDEITAPGARLYAVVDASGERAIPPVRLKLLDLGHVSREVLGSPEPAQRQLLPAQMERLLRPFDVVRAFTLRQGLREYVAIKA